jgi:hypothetical protein
MEYMTSVNMKIQTFVPCKCCKLWFPVYSNHSCSENIDNTVHNFNVNWNISL